MKSRHKIFLGADHGGWLLKERLKPWLAALGHPITDVGAIRRRPLDDYPVYARAVGQAIQRQPTSRGILFCRTGVGMALAANRLRGVRAVQAFEVKQVQRSRQEEDTNVLTVAADFTSLEQAKRLIRVWLTTAFRQLRRYRRRLRAVDRLA